MRKIRIVLDTNVIISGIYWSGNPRKIVALWKKGKIKICHSPETLAELINKLQKKFKMPSRFLKRWQNLFEGNSVLYLPETKVNLCRDKKDNKFLELCLVSQADYLITGDQDLLTLKKFKNTKIVRPAKFLKERLA